MYTERNAVVTQLHSCGTRARVTTITLHQHINLRAWLIIIYSQEVQTRLNEQVDIYSILLVPMERFLSYSDVLGTMQKAAKTAQLDTPILTKAHSLMVDIRRKANNTYTLNIIRGYDGNIHSGELIEHVRIYITSFMRLTTMLDGLSVIIIVSYIPSHTHTYRIFSMLRSTL